MITTFFRSSSWSCWDFCEHKYYLDYILGYHSPANKKAEQGNVVHKALEMMAQRKLAKQRGVSKFEVEDYGEFTVDGCIPEIAVSLAYNKIKEDTEKYGYDWDDKKDYNDCLKWTWMALEYKDGMFSPLKRHVLESEKFFEIEIDKPWASYDFEIDGKHITGKLGLKGTIDLILDGGDGVIEVVDWKSGAYRKDINTNEEKTHSSFYKDMQLRMYHYALSKLYPDKEILITIFYIRVGGPFTVSFGPEDLPETEERIRQRWEKIKKTVRPHLIYPHFKCYNFCWFNKNLHPGTDETECQFYKKKIIQLGIDKVTEQYAKNKDFNEYGSGGGRRV